MFNTDNTSGHDTDILQMGLITIDVKIIVTIMISVVISAVKVIVAIMKEMIDLLRCDITMTIIIHTTISIIIYIPIEIKGIIIFRTGIPIISGVLRKWLTVITPR